MQKSNIVGRRRILGIVPYPLEERGGGEKALMRWIGLDRQKQLRQIWRSPDSDNVSSSTNNPIESDDVPQADASE